MTRFAGKGDGSPGTDRFAADRWASGPRPRAAALAMARVAAALIALTSATVALLVPAPVRAQMLPVGDSWEEYSRVLQVAGVAAPAHGFLIRPLGMSHLLGAIAEAPTTHPWAGRVAAPHAWTFENGLSVTLLDPKLRLFLNNSRPYGPNEGAVWAGSGVTMATDVGFAARWGPVTATFAPTAAFAENADYATFATTRTGAYDFAYPWRRIDTPQRFGTESFWTVDPGQSSLRIDFGAATVGFGTENLWWGPGIRNALLMSNNAAGFPHGFLETNRPVGIGIGTLEAQWIWGRIAQSDWFDTTYVDRSRFLTGVALSYEPEGVPGLHLGVARVFYESVPEGGVPFGDYFLVLQGIEKVGLLSEEDPSGDDDRDQLASVFFRWVLPESGFELWLEWARNDHGWDIRDYLLQPEHAGARIVGLRKTLTLADNRLLSLEVEATTAQKPLAGTIRAAPSYYAHHIVLPGYTHRGEVLGGWVGPGGSAQHGGATLFTRDGSWGLYLQRQVVDNDAYYSRPGVDKCCHHVLMDAEFEALRYFGEFEGRGSLMFTHELNRYFVERSDHQHVSWRLEGRWRPR